MAQRSETTHDRPAPQGPRRATHARYPPTRSLISQGSKRTLAVDKFEDAIGNPGMYSQMYPEVLPITLRLHRQIRTEELIASEAAAATNNYHNAMPPKVALGAPCFAPPPAASSEAFDPNILFRGLPEPMIEAEMYGAGGSIVRDEYPCVIPPASFPEPSQATIANSWGHQECINELHVENIVGRQWWPADLAERGQWVGFEPPATMDDQELIDSFLPVGENDPSDMLVQSTGNVV
ncbi:hypothetical protein C2E23DRAFT_863635 [Lenzites betulinus]|nr:hypothetical protein C2E23DRAFT_863635 [Lenzites betulinus]